MALRKAFGNGFITPFSIVSENFLYDSHQNQNEAKKASLFIASGTTEKLLFTIVRNASASGPDAVRR